MPKKPILVGALGLLVAAGAYRLTPGGAESRVPTWDDADWTIFHDRVRAALDEGLDTIPLGDAMAALGRTFVGTAYVPHTLEADGPEHVVIDFRGLDCVTFVETVFTTARFVRLPDAERLIGRRGDAERRYEALLTELRYRGGKLAAYPSRLHYFTDWIADGERKGLLRDVTREVGGVRDTEPIDFMTSHVEAYRQLEESPADVEAMAAVERKLSAKGRWYVPEARIDEVAPGIREGDIIAATSTVRGLDVAHTGLALWIDGALHLMHAPLVGDSVQISEQTLAQRVRRITGQDGIIVARPMEGGAR